MRSALGALDGFHGLDGEVGDPDFEVRYDPAKLDVAKMKAACDASGHAVVVRR